MLDRSYINLLIAHQYAFALYRQPNTDQYEFIMQKGRQPKIIKNYSQLAEHQGFVIAPFTIKNTSPCVIISPDLKATGETAISEVLSRFCQKMKLSPKEKKAKENTINVNYQEQFSLFYAALLKGDFRKLVLSYPSQIKKPANFCLINSFYTACLQHPQAFVYLTYSPLTGIWFGATPELLLKQHAEKGSTIALAGTRHKDSPQDWDDKNHMEQQLVNDYIVSTLQPFTKQIVTGDTQTFTSGSLKHLKTELHFSLQQGITVGDLITALHPTPAVCGLPKQQALQFIIQNEKYHRQYYSGFIGKIDSQQTCLYVNLRCAQCLDDTLILYAGGGLLPASDLQQEWMEINAKLSVIHTILKSNKTV